MPLLQFHTVLMDDHNRCILLWKRFVTWPSQVIPGFGRPKDYIVELTQFQHRLTPYFRLVLPNKSLTCVLTFMMRTINQPYLHIMRKSHFISPLIRLLCGAVILKNSHRQKSNGTLTNYNSIFFRIRKNRRREKRKSSSLILVHFFCCEIFKFSKKFEFSKIFQRPILEVSRG